MLSHHLEFEQQLRDVYEPQHGWKGPDDFLFVSVPHEKGVKLQEGAWAPSACCVEAKCTHVVPKERTVVPKMVSWDVLERVHPKKYLDMLQTSRKELYDIFEQEVEEASLTEGDKRFVLDPLRHCVGATMLATALAYVYGSVVSTEGSMHHASTEMGEGSGVFADVPLAWITLREHLMEMGVHNPQAMYLDVDVHHCNGTAYARDELGIQDHFHLVDLYNKDIWPVQHDQESLQHLTVAKGFPSGTGSRRFLELLREALAEAEQIKPDILFYCAYNDTLKGDPLGECNVTAKGIHQRDRMVIQWARERNIPICIFYGGGYGSDACQVARDTLVKLNDEFGVWEPPTTPTKRMKLL